MTYLDPQIWGPHYWFFLHTLSMTYPVYPNAVTKKKYYEFINNLPLFIPIENISSEFQKLLQKYPIAPYLDTRKTFIQWLHFIHNKINTKLEKPIIPIEKFYINYYEAYKSKNIKIVEYLKLKKKIVYISLLMIIIIVIYFLYNK